MQINTTANATVRSKYNIKTCDFISGYKEQQAVDKLSTKKNMNLDQLLPEIDFMNRQEFSQYNSKS